MENGRQQNYWPGFVDALSNLVLTLVFVMTIFILALFYLSGKVTQGKVEKLCPETQAELMQVKKDLDESRNALHTALTEVRQAQEQIQALKKEQSRSDVMQKNSSLFNQRVDVAKPQQENNKSAELSRNDSAKLSINDSTELSRNNPTITIRFPLGVVELDKGAKEALDKMLVPFIAEKQQMKISLNAIPGPETYSEGRRLSFFRAVSIRNYMIGKGISKAGIESMVADHGNSDPKDPDGRVVIQLQHIAK